MIAGRMKSHSLYGKEVTLMILATLYVLAVELLLILGKIIVWTIEAVLIWLIANGLFKLVVGKGDHDDK